MDATATHEPTASPPNARTSLLGVASLVACACLFVVFLRLRHGIDIAIGVRLLAALYFLCIVPGHLVLRWVFRIRASSPFAAMVSAMLLGVFVTPLAWYAANLVHVAAIFAPAVILTGLLVPIACGWHRNLRTRLANLVTVKDVPILLVTLALALVWSYELNPIEVRGDSVRVVTPWGDHCHHAALVGEMGRGLPPQHVPFVVGAKVMGYHIMPHVFADLLRRATGADSLDAYFYLALPLRYVFISLACYLALLGRFGRFKATMGTACMLGFVLYPTKLLYVNGLLLYLHGNYPAAFGVIGLFLTVYFVCLGKRDTYRGPLLLASILSTALLWFKANHALPIGLAVGAFNALFLIRRRDLRWLALCVGTQVLLVGVRYVEIASADVQNDTAFAPFAFVEFWWRHHGLPQAWQPLVQPLVDGMPGLVRAPLVYLLSVVHSFPLAIGIGVYLVVACGFLRSRAEPRQHNRRSFDVFAALFLVSCLVGFVVFPISASLVWNVSVQIFPLINALMFALLGPALYDLTQRIMRKPALVACAVAVVAIGGVAVNAHQLRSRAFWETRRTETQLDRSLYESFEYVREHTATDAIVLQPHIVCDEGLVPAAAMLTQRRLVVECGDQWRNYYDMDKIIRDAKALYATDDPAVVRSVLRRYAIGIVVAESRGAVLERGDACLVPVFARNDAVVYAVDQQCLNEHPKDSSALSRLKLRVHPIRDATVREWGYAHRTARLTLTRARKKPGRNDHSQRPGERAISVSCKALRGASPPWTQDFGSGQQQQSQHHKPPR